MWAGLTGAAFVDNPRAPARAAADFHPRAHWMFLSPVEMAGFAYYEQERCDTCHNLSSGEPKIGPTLATVAQRKSAGWMIAHSKDPASVVPGSPMPPSALDTQQLNSIAAFLLKLTPEKAPGIEAAPPFALEGARIYQENYCGNCHIINGAGMQVGPPLSGVGSRRPKQWLREKIQNPAGEAPDTLMPIYDLTADQLEVLASYLVQLPEE